MAGAHAPQPRAAHARPGGAAHAQPRYEIADIGLAGEGAARIAWASEQMPVLGQVRDRFAAQRPLEGIRVAACLHVTAETANLLLTLIAGGAQAASCSFGRRFQIGRPSASARSVSVNGVRHQLESFPSLGSAAPIFKRYAGSGSPGITAPQSPETITTLAARRVRWVCVSDRWSSAS